MWGGIGTNLRIFFIAATLSLTSYLSFCQEFFVGGKKCMKMPAMPPGPNGQAQSADCNEPTIFFDTNPDATAWEWNFGDGSTPATTRNPQHSYDQAGTYIVTLIRTVNSIVQAPVTETVIISQPPQQPKFFDKISADTTVCDGKTVRLDPYKGSAPPPGVTYLWFPKGQTTPTIDVTEAGCYSVEVFDPSGQCSRTAKINIKFCLQQSNSSGGGEKWYFGTGATLEFGLNPSTPIERDPLEDNGDLFEDPEEEDPTYVPVTPSKDNPIDSPEGAAMVYGSKGDLVFYTDGVKIYRGSDDQPMAFFPPLTNSDLGGTNTSIQSSLIIPKNSCNECPNHLYYIYTLNETTGMLSYSVVDMRRDDGKGAVVEKDVPVSFTSAPQIATRKAFDDSGNEVGYYIYSHDSKTNEFRILKVDSTGTTERTQALGIDDADATGYMRISPLGDKLAMAIVKNGQNFIEVYDIDPETGSLKLNVTIDLKIPAPPMVYGLEFSYDAQLLYTTLRGDPATGVKSYLYQLNLNRKDPAVITAEKIKIDESATYTFGALQMGPVNSVGAIYMAVDGRTLLPYISQPDALGGASIVGYVPVSNVFGAEVIGESHFGFPNVVRAKPQQDGEGLSATYQGTCQGQPTKFSTQGICSPMKAEIHWDFGDGTTGTGKEPTHIYEKEGTYKIIMTVDVFSETVLSQNVNIPLLGNALKQKCNTFVVTDEIYIKPTPVPNLPDEDYLCVLKGLTKVLNPKATNTVDPQYLWTPTSETTPTITISALATYGVTVSNKFVLQSGTPVFCKVKDEVVVKEGCEPQLFVPEAFTPNGDGKNDRFELPHEFITDFDLKIYNRWGEIIFESFEPDKLWDGTYKGKLMAPMLYAFVVSYKSEYFPERPKITKTGGILLIK
ncbi:PKD domain-containing protein [Emticicia sp. BO119]|uniref:PKD domain-containing protein n=1 Tax=Emticicia sp. BO119 TaxID=2757768 RepID=UPI0015F0C1CA|nr:PKD domain-containing protein [Emticicia sp. BO119]MBA4851620.1 gliding motility-associated C-terminal domain-containing protein [Emticicia sp. BO119]